MISRYNNPKGLKVLLLVCCIAIVGMATEVQAQNVRSTMTVAVNAGATISTVDGGRTWLVTTNRNVSGQSAQKFSAQYRGTVEMPQGRTVAFPNPARGLLSIQYGLEEPSEVCIALHDSHGSEVLRANEGPRVAGDHTLQLDTTPLPDGVYFYRVISGGMITAGSTVVVTH